jgi:hypothetical protein
MGHACVHRIVRWVISPFLEKRRLSHRKNGMLALKINVRSLGAVCRPRSVCDQKQLFNFLGFAASLAETLIAITMRTASEVIAARQTGLQTEFDIAPP